jgi:hypothetical protein
LGGFLTKEKTSTEAGRPNLPTNSQITVSCIIPIVLFAANQLSTIFIFSSNLLCKMMYSRLIALAMTGFAAQGKVLKDIESKHTY